MLNKDDIVVVKSNQDFVNDVYNGCCSYDNDTQTIHYKDSYILFSAEMRKFCNKKFLVANYISDDEIYLYTDEDNLTDVVKYVFTKNMLKPYADDTDVKDDLSKEDYLNLISFVNHEYSDLVAIMKRSISLESEEYIINRMKYLDKLKEKLCDKILK